MDIDPASPSPRPLSAMVTARDVLIALSAVRRRGQWPLLQELELLEPDLAEFVLEELSAIHHTLTKTQTPPRIARRLQRQIQSLVLVSVLAMERAYRGDGDVPSPPEADPQLP